MFHSILIKNSFLQRDIYIEFEEGLNVLVGKNGCGKSTVLEYLAYSLYGTNALRSPIKDFPTGFTVEAEFSVSSIQYKVTRTAKSSSLYELVDDKYVELVKSTAQVNNKIKELLGYDYSIFTLVNLIKQHDLLTLTESTPTQLLSLVELVSGLSGSYKLEEQLKQRRKEAKVEEEALKISIDVALKDIDNIFEKNDDFELLINSHEDPVEFIKISSKSYLDSIDTLNKQIYYLETKLTESSQLSTTISSLSEFSNLELSEYQQKYDEILKLELEEEKLKAIIAKTSVPEKEYSLEYLKEQENLLSVYNEYQQEQKLKVSLDKHKVECPNCNHSFYNTAKNVSFKFDKEPTKPILTLDQIYAGKSWLNNSVAYYNDVQKLSEIQSSFSIVDKENIKSKLDSITELLQAKDKYSTLIENLNSLEYYDKDKSIQDNIDILKKSKTEYENLYNDLDSIRNDFLSYINKKIEFEKKEEVRKNFGEKIQEIQTKKRIYSVLLDTLKQVKADIQTTILPKLNHTSSQLLSEMTCGERNKVYISDDFKLSVDNQLVSTLEGSAQVLTNIALRCALLTTFYSDSFLVSLQDESDAPLALERFEALVEAYKKLENQNFQLIVISHKDYDYGNIINLEDRDYIIS